MHTASVNDEEIAFMVEPCSVGTEYLFRRTASVVGICVSSGRTGRKVWQPRIAHVRNSFRSNGLHGRFVFMEMVRMVREKDAVPTRNSYP